ncbi:MAG TPA: DUF488 domain-containing protein [Methylomusa anaerophila]|uniref:DUF488 domain-containing protein n=1 Tax=Methylomusa anaerophila TaxID=1930071 RepID=A0A348AN22_9FIRM|nr:DUF488 domain-containing protein [Methylomusa anaerophila]BBB92470.1 hypothetical protein MAMMFC1_03163 [Methylomusa anaerophila]HML87678.1 DUF488 domain-containing protein [Methylomusa anaerophila]
MDSKQKLYTIGHSTVANTFFLKLLRQYEVNCIVDVRSVPFSRHAPQFNKDELSKFLRKNTIKYVSMGQEFGARRDDLTLYTEAGYLDFEKTRKSSLFLHGVERIEKGMHSGFSIALMCTEKMAIECHRSILIAKKFYDMGYDVYHIQHDENSYTHKDLELELVKHYFPNRNAINMFVGAEENALSFQEMVLAAYRYHNAEIGYKIHEETETVHL